MLKHDIFDAGSAASAEVLSVLASVLDSVLATSVLSFYRTVLSYSTLVLSFCSGCSSGNN